MIVCKIEMWPGGSQAGAYDLGCIEIANEGGTATHGDYGVRLTKSARLSRRPGATWKRGAVRGFPRKRLGAYDLVLRALANAIGDRNPEAANASSLQLSTIERLAEVGGAWPLDGRPGYQEVPAVESELARDLGQFLERHGLVGAVLVSFRGDRVGVNTSGQTEQFAGVMEWLGSQILTAIDDGKFGAPRTNRAATEV